MRGKIVVSLIILIFFSSIVSSANIEIIEKLAEEYQITDENAFDGYTLYAPLYTKNTYLINNNGEIVHEWRSRNGQGLPVYLLENGNLLRSRYANRGRSLRFITGGVTGGVEMLDWDGNLVWEFAYSSRDSCLHNDIEPLPNGNILMTVWNHKNHAEAIAAGCNPRSLNLFGGILVDYIIEVEPTFPKGGNIVWQWHFWDHLIQDYDSTKDNYGVVADHPELLDVNCDRPNKYPSLRTRLRVPIKSSELLHTNSIDYNEELDQIILSSFALSEIYIIDHSTTTEEAKGHTGGKYGKGGDFLYRWGNPRNYDVGAEDDQKLFHQHDARWIEPGCPGEGNITIFNNLNTNYNYLNPAGKYHSSVYEIVPPIDETGNYTLEPGSAYGPEEPIWNYTADPPSSFLSYQVSGAQRLPNGNTFICSGFESIFFEVTPEKEIVWKYINNFPFSNTLVERFPRLKKYNWVFKTQTYPADYPGLEKLNID